MLERWTIEDYKKYLERGAGERKYRNQKTEVDGHIFDSRAEADRYEELKLLVRSGEIKGFAIQPSFFLSPGIRYRPDFLVCGADDRIWIEDVKGFSTKEFKLKQKLFMEKYPWLELRIIR